MFNHDFIYGAAGVKSGIKFENAPMRKGSQTIAGFAYACFWSNAGWLKTLKEGRSCIDV